MPKNGVEVNTLSTFGKMTQNMGERLNDRFECEAFEGKMNDTTENGKCLLLSLHSFIFRGLFAACQHI